MAEKNFRDRDTKYMYLCVCVCVLIEGCSPEEVDKVEGSEGGYNEKKKVGV